VAQCLATLRAAIADRVVQQRVVMALPPSAPPSGSKAEAEAVRIERALRDGPEALGADDGLRLLSSRSALVLMHREVVAGRAHPAWGQASEEGVVADDAPTAPMPGWHDSDGAVIAPDREHAIESI
jgi:hypothetical protein